MYANYRRYIRSINGASAVEFALVAPVFLFLIAAVVGYGLMFLTAMSLQQLGADVTRATIGGATQGEKANLADGLLTSATNEYVLIDNTRVQVDVDYDLGNEMTVVHLQYDITGHPIEIFRGILPMPENTFHVRQTISEHAL